MIFLELSNHYHISFEGSRQLLKVWVSVGRERQSSLGCKNNEMVQKSGQFADDKNGANDQIALQI